MRGSLTLRHAGVTSSSAGHGAPASVRDERRPGRPTGVRVEAVGRTLCSLGGGLGALGLLGWVTKTSALTTIVPGQPPMVASTAVALLLLGSAGALLRPERVGRVRRTLAVLAAIVVLVIGVGTLVEYALGTTTEQLLRSGGGPLAWRSSPPTALALILLGGALVLFDSRPTARARPSEWLILSAALIALTAVLGQLLGAGPFYRLTYAPVIGVAVPTALSLLLTSVGLLLERPDAGFMRVATSPGPGGRMLRRLVPAAVLAPAALGVIVVRVLALFGVEDLPLVSATLAVVMTMGGLFLIAVTAVPLERTHEALELSRSRSRDLIEHASDGIFVADLEGRYTDVNSAGCRMLGYAREEIVGKTIMDLILPEDVGRLAESKALLDAGDTHVAEWTLRRKDGDYLPVEVSAKIIRGGRWQGIVRDISVRKRAEEALRLSEAKLAGMFAISADAIITIDESQRITAFNAGAEKIFGYSKEELLGASLGILVPERLRARHREHVDRFAGGPDVARRMGEPGAGIVCRRSNGEEFPADAAISKLDVGGKPILTITVRDITDLKRVEVEQRLFAEVGSVLAATLEYEDTLSNIARLAVRDLTDLCLVDIVEDNGEIQRLKVVSRDPSKAWACEVLKQLPVDPKPPLLASVLASQKPVLIERLAPETVSSWARSEEHLRALREIDPGSLIMVPLLARGKLLGVVSLVSATSSRAYGLADVRFAEGVAGRAALSLENARLYRAAQRATQARDDVLGVVAHDLRNPLGIILIQTALLRRREGEPERRSPRPLDAIERAATRMARLLRDLLDATRMDAGSFAVERAQVAPAQVVADSVEAQTELASAASLELRLDVTPELPDVWADRDRLLQVFENLVGNAVKFTEPGGRITVGAAPRDGGVLFWIADTGAGIPAEHLPHLFDRFWQAGKVGHRGAGLGLGIVKGIVEAHGGRIWVESTPGQGSTFFFTIPAPPRTEGGAP